MRGELLPALILMLTPLSAAGECQVVEYRDHYEATCQGKRQQEQVGYRPETPGLVARSPWQEQPDQAGEVPVLRSRRGAYEISPSKEPDGAAK